MEGQRRTTHPPTAVAQNMSPSTLNNWDLAVVLEIVCSAMWVPSFNFAFTTRSIVNSAFDSTPHSLTVLFVYTMMGAKLHNKPNGDGTLVPRWFFTHSVTQQSLAPRPACSPKWAHPTPPQVPHSAAQHTVPPGDSTPVMPLLHTEEPDIVVAWTAGGGD